MKRALLIMLMVCAVPQLGAQKTEGLAEGEALKLENVRLQAALNQCTVQKQAIDLVAEVEKNHPGFTLDLKTGDLTKKEVKK